MRNRTILFLASLLIGTGLVGFSFAGWFDLSALPEPGPLETRIATAGKRWLVYRESHARTRQEPSATPESLANGQNLFGAQCGICHGVDGRTPSEIGRTMYPRTPDLTSAEEQRWSDSELFWIVRNGIRLSGMPAFGEHLSTKEVWDLVHYVRRLQTAGQLAGNQE